MSSSFFVQFMVLTRIFLMGTGCGVVILVNSCTTVRQKNTVPAGQVPSPMKEQIRVHERLVKETPAGTVLQIDNILSKPITLYLPWNSKAFESIDVLIHFNGASFIPIQAIDGFEKPLLVVVVNQGSGSSSYEAPFEEPKVFDRLVQEVQLQSGIKTINRVYCSAFSAGYGAVRELLKSHMDKIDGLLLLDGLHTDYLPKKVPLANGGKLNTEKLNGFLTYAKKAVSGDKKMIITHSEIFPGTYASTTETSEWLIQELNLERTPMLKWGPVGMQQLGETVSGKLKIMAFAGNSAPDHMDHFHGMPFFFNSLYDQ